MTDAYKRAMVASAIAHPELAREIKTQMLSLGMTDVEYEDIAHMLAMNPQMIEASVTRSQTSQHPDNPDPAVYLTVRSAMPALKAGDRVWESANGTLFWISWADHADPFVPSGFAFKGTYDGKEVVVPEPYRFVPAPPDDALPQ